MGFPKQVVVLGNQKMAQLAHFYFTNDSDFDVVAFTVDQPHINASEFCGLPVIPFDVVADAYPPDQYSMFVAIGYRKLNSIRKLKYEEARGKGYHLVSYVSSKATGWGDTEVGDNCFILENQVIQPYVTFGNNVFIWSGNHFGHDVVVGAHTWITSHCVFSGNVTVGERCFVGVNATMRDHITIGDETIIGAGALVLGDLEPKSVLIEGPTELYPLDSHMFERMMDNARADES